MSDKAGPEFHIGCSGWSYSQWVGPFYPRGTRPGDFLKIYSRIFDTVEIDSTFYRIPGKPMVENWRRATPDNFCFLAKFPKSITHEQRLKDPEKDLAPFLDSMRILGDKLRMLLVQLPPFLTFSEGFDDLSKLADILPGDLSFAVEFRHDSWFREESYELLREHGITMVWNEVQRLETPPVLTTRNVYLRLIGDRSIMEADFGRIQKDRSPEIGKWARRIAEEKYNLDHVFSGMNNHFQGFGPATVNLVRKELGLDTVDWSSVKPGSIPDSQKTLF